MIGKLPSNPRMGHELTLPERKWKGNCNPALNS
jgi:hypothetical protein